MITYLAIGLALGALQLVTSGRPRTRLELGVLLAVIVGWGPMLILNLFRKVWW